MSVGHVLLGLLERAPRHGYELKHVYDGRFGRDRPINFGQIYTTLGRLERDGRVTVEAVEAGQGPERKLYGITAEGVVDLERWLREPEPPEPHLQSVFFAKVVLALLSDRPAEEFLDTQRAAHLSRMRELTSVKRGGSLSGALAADYALFHLEADLRWIELTSSRLTKLREEIR